MRFSYESYASNLLKATVLALHLAPFATCQAAAHLVIPYLYRFHLSSSPLG